MKKVMIVLGLMLAMPAVAEARSPARKTCTLTKKDKKAALKEARKAYPKISGFAAGTNCYCVLPECETIEVHFAPFEQREKKARITFEVSQVSVLVDRVTAPNVMRMPSDDAASLSVIADAIRSYTVTRDLFGQAALRCRVKAKNPTQASFTCATDKAGIEAMNGGRPRPGARTMLVHWQGGKLDAGIFSMPVKAANRKVLEVWDRAMLDRAVRTFVGQYPDAWLTVLPHEVSLTDASGAVYTRSFHRGGGSVYYMVPATLVDDYFPGWIDVKDKARDEVLSVGEEKAWVWSNGTRVTVGSKGSKGTAFHAR